MFNYKNLIKSRELRIKILNALSWVPDELMVRMQYWIHTGRRLNLKNPKRFTEKLQVYKLKYRNPLMLRCTDKYEVREVVKEMGLGDILIPLIGVYNSTKEINFSELPNQFVAKTTDGGGGNQVLICRNKAKLNEAEFMATLNRWLGMPKTKSFGREWAYENGFPRRILIEKLLTNAGIKDIPDYKFFCFDGKPVYCQVIGDRSTEETIDFFDMNWNHMPFRGLNNECRNAAMLPQRPEKFEEMKEVASTLSKGYPFVRVDLYCNGGEVSFGELTFYPASGLGNFTPDEFDCKIGNLMTLSTIGGGKMRLGRVTSLSTSLVDYKFFCFNGKVRMVYGIHDRKVGQSAKLGIYSKDFVKLNVVRNDEEVCEESLPVPVNYDMMLQIAERLSSNFPHVRVDLYNVDGRIYFGELTFYDGSGYMSFTPDSYDVELGAYFETSDFMS